MHVLKTRPVPFVVKLQQTIGGYGTFVVENEEDRIEVSETFETAVLSNLLAMVTPENKHMKPECLIFTDFVPSEESMGIAFFVKKSGESMFISGSLQRFTAEHHYDGSMIDFTAQDGFKAEYTDLVNKVAAYLHR
jgi:hypothetical protein